MATNYSVPDRALLERIALEDLGETEEIRNECLDRLRSMSRDYLPNKDDFFLLRFLRVSKFDVEKAFDRVKTYSQLYKKYEADLLKSSFSEAVYVLRNRILGISPTRSNNHLIYYYNMEQWDPRVFSGEEHYRATIKLMDRAFHDQHLEELDIMGIEYVVDFKGFTMRRFLLAGVSPLLKLMDVGIRMYPIRIQAVHYVNGGYVAKVFFRVIYPFIPDKIRSRIHFHDDYDSLNKMVDPSALPEYMGGTGCEGDVEYWANRWFPEEKIPPSNHREIEKS